MSYNKIYYSTGYTGYLKAGETMDKTKLISLVRCGDEKAVNELYYRTYRQPYTVVLDVVNSVSDAYGIMQDAYREAFLHIDRISDYACFSKAINRLSLFMGAVFLKKERQQGHAPVQILISVPKKRFKHAVDRNRVKRQIREAYRLHKQLLGNCITDDQELLIAFIWLSDSHCPSNEVEKRMISLLQRIAKK